MELFAQLLVSASVTTIKKRVPPMAQSIPNDAAMCIASFLLSGFLSANTPEKNIGTPKKEGKYEVQESDSEISDTNTPHKIKKIP